MLVKYLSITALLCVVATVVCGQELGFEGFGRRDGLHAETIVDFDEDHEGRLWIATSGQGLLHFDGFNFEQIEETASDTIVDVGVFNQSVYFMTAHGIQHIKSDWSIEETLHFNSQQFEKFCVLNDSIWLIDSSGQLHVAHEQNIILYKNEIGINDFFMHQGKIILLTETGIHALHGGWKSLSTLPADLSVYCAATQEDTVYVATKEGVWKLASTPELIPNTIEERVKSLSIDVRNNLWMAARNHVLIYNGYHTKMLTEANGLPSAKVRKLLTDRSGAIWFGSSTAGLFMLRDMSTQMFAQEHGFPETPISATARQNDSTLWFGTTDGSVFKWSLRSTPEIIYQSSGKYLRNAVTEILPCASGIYFSLEQEGTLMYNQQNTTTTFNQTRRSLAGCGNYSLEWDGVVTPTRKIFNADLACENLTDIELFNDSLIVATSCGLYVMSLRKDGTVIVPDNMSTFLPIAGSDGFYFTVLFLDQHGQLWLGTKNDGLLRYKHGLDVVARKSLSDQHVTGICRADDGNIWVSTTSGLSMIELTPDGDLVLNVSNYPLEYPVSPRTLQFFDGKLAYGSTRGLVTFDPRGVFPDFTPPIIVIDEVFVNYEFPFASELEYDQNHLTFHFHAIDLADPFNVAYQCRLVGFETDFHDITSPAVYPQLAPGNYTFEVRARNHDGIWSDEAATISFTIDAPFYAKPWFIVGTAFIALLIVFVFIRWRVRALRLANKALEEKVVERTKELSIERDRSERLLLNILPKETADELKQNGYAMTKSYRQASVLFSDFKGFTMMSEMVSSSDLVSLLDEAFKSFDRACDRFGVEKIKTIGDAYMCATGLPLAAEDHAEQLVLFAFAMLEEMRTFNEKLAERNLPPWQIRIGIHSGPLIAGVVGEKKFAYDIWGDTVNTASRMESSGEPNRINISATTYEIIKDKFRCTNRGLVAAKNKGELEMYFVEEHL